MRWLLCSLWFSVLVLPLESSRAGEPELRVGMELSYPPFEMTDPQGNPSGVSVGLAQALAASMGKILKIENMPFEGLIPSLKTGRIDLIISSMTATDERRRSVDFSDPYLRTGLCLLTGINSKIEKPEELNQAGVKVAVKKGTTGYFYATEHLPKAEILVLDREQACVLEVVQGKAAAFIYDQMSVLKNWQQNPKTTRALLVPFREEGWAIAIRKGNDGLKTEVNDFLAKFSKEGGFVKLGDEYLKEQKDAFVALGYPFFWPPPPK